MSTHNLTTCILSCLCFALLYASDECIGLLFQILKDITIRHKLLQGHKIHYVPGWDCHGLPIELKALSRAQVSSVEISPLEIRKKGK